MSTRQTENSRWTEDDQKPVFRHVAALALVRRGPVLDLGCGDGLLLAMLRAKNIAGQGLDLSDVAVGKCRDKGLVAAVHDFSDTAKPLPFPAGSFATVALLDTLEHVEAPDWLLGEALRVAAGDVIIGVPNFNSLPARVQVMRGRVPENNQPGKLHVYWFNLSVLQKILQRHGARIGELRCNTFWEHKPLVGRLMRVLVKKWPGLFALSFVLRAAKNT